MLPSQLPILDVPVAVDTETSGLFCDDGATVSVVSLAWSEDEGQTVTSAAFPFDQGMRDKFPQTTLNFEEDPNLPEEEWIALLEWLEKHWLVYWNAKFDETHMRNGTRHWDGIDLGDRFLWDAFLGARLLDPTLPASLKLTSERLALWGGGEADAQELLKAALGTVPGGRFDLVPWSVMQPYAAGDADLTIRNFYQQVARYEAGEGNRGHLERAFRWCQVLYAVEWRGIGYDAERSRQAWSDLGDWEREIARTMPFNPTIESARKWFFEHAPEVMDKFTAKGKINEYTGKGKPAIDSQVVAKLVAAGIPWAEEFELIRKIRTARTKWYKPFADAVGADGRLRTNFRQEKVVSGRLSSERVNLQAIPHTYQLDRLVERVPTVRSLFVPTSKRRGSKLWELDLSQAELRIAAKMANCQPMLEKMRVGVDLHADTAVRIFDVDPSMPEWFEKRQVSKRANFSFIFDVGAVTFQETLAKLTGIYISLTESEDIVAVWKMLYPEFRRQVYSDKAFADRQGWVQLANGKLRWFLVWEDRHKAFNQRVQGSLAEMVADWMVAVERRWPGLLVLTIHDSLVLDTGNRSIVQKAANLGAAIGTKMFKVPMTVDVKEWH